MIEVKAYCAGVELYPADSLAHESLRDVLVGVHGLEFAIQVLNPNSNQGQMISDFDDQSSVGFSDGARQYVFFALADGQHDRFQLCRILLADRCRKKLRRSYLDFVANL